MKEDDKTRRIDRESRTSFDKIEEMHKAMMSLSGLKRRVKERESYEKQTKGPMQTDVGVHKAFTHVWMDVRSVYVCIRIPYVRAHDRRRVLSLDSFSFVSFKTGETRQ